MKEIKSSNISHIDYAADAKVLTVRFKTGSEYQYAEVPAEVYEAFSVSTSAGKFFAKSIRPNYAFKKAGTEEWTAVVTKTAPQ